MSFIKPSVVTPELYRYAVEHSSPETPILAALRTATLDLPHGSMISSPEQVQCISLFLQLMQAVHVIEIGTFTGYTSLAMALHVPPHGRVLTCDISDAGLAIAVPHWERAGVRNRIDFIHAPAVDLFDHLSALQRTDHFDLAYIDADKRNNALYYQKLIPLIRPGGLIIVDNVLWKGRVLDQLGAPLNKHVDTIRAFNTMVRADSRVHVCMLLIGDGMSVIHKHVV